MLNQTQQAQTQQQTEFESPLQRILKEKSPTREDHLREQGYTIIPSGILKRVRVNKNYIMEYSDYPYFVACGKFDEWDWEEKKEVIMLEQTTMKCGEQPFGCGFSRSAWIETTGPIAVK